MKPIDVTNPDLPSSADYRALGAALRALREQAGLSQLEAAKQIGIRNTFISQIEHGHRGMRWHTLLGVIAAYDADLRDLADAIDAAAK